MINGLKYLGNIFELVQKLVKSRGFLRCLNIFQKNFFLKKFTQHKLQSHFI